MSIFFEAMLSKIESRKTIKIPFNSSKTLPSRGMIMIEGTVNGVNFKAPLEPDGKGSHWSEISDKLCEEAGVMVDDTISFNIEPVNDWIEPEIPEDIIDVIMKAGFMNQWNAVTTKARWEWLRWIRSTRNPTTRQKRIDVACSKLQKGDKSSYTKRS